MGILRPQSSEFVFFFREGGSVAYRPPDNRQSAKASACELGNPQSPLEWRLVGYWRLV